MGNNIEFHRFEFGSHTPEGAKVDMCGMYGSTYDFCSADCAIKWIEHYAEPRDDIPEYSIPPETAKMDATEHATEHATEQLIFNAWIDAGFEILDPDNFEPNYVAMLQDLSEAARESG